MTEAAYAVVFRGELVDGFELDQVKAGFARLFGLGGERLEQLFGSSQVVIKRGLSHADATRYRDALRSIGAVVTVEAPPARVTAAPAPAPDSAPASALAQTVASAAPAPRSAAAPDPTPVAAVAAAAGLAPARPAREASAQPRPAARKTVPAALPADFDPGALTVIDDGSPIVPPGGAAAGAGEGPRVLPFAFRGEGFEYFRIWIVNVLLSIVTLGIYSAWAKVRTQRYFYGNTSLDGSSFEYLATPMQILKGRLIAFALFAVYVIVDGLLPLLGVAMMLVLVLATPWIVVRALAFRNRHSAWRGVRFGFDGRVLGAVKALLLWPLAGVLTFGLLMPLAMQRQQRFLIDHSRYGTSAFGFEAGARPFYGLFIRLLLAGAVGGALSFGLGQLFAPLGVVIMALTYLVLIAWFNTGFTNLVYGNSVLGEHRLVAHYELKSYLMLMIGNAVGMVLTLGLFYPWAKVRNARYAAAHIAFDAADGLDGFVAAQRDAVAATGGEVADLFDVDVGL